MSDVGPDAIGGYFELELPDKARFPFFEALRFQSARAAFLALLRAGRPKRVWMPKYICDAMLSPLVHERIECVWYDLNDQLSVDEIEDFRIDDWLLYVNYFGICNAKVTDLLQRFSPDQVVLDYSQAFFAPPEEEALATMYSPRKFFGVPDGGLLISRIPISPPAAQDTGSFGRTPHLLTRLAKSPEAGYAEYQRAEKSLEACEPKRMSKLTERILTSIDFDRAGKKRMDNFLYLHQKIGKLNSIAIERSYSLAPLCYPFITHDQGLRNRLANARIFVPTYWQDAIGRVSDDWSDRMIMNLLPLPIDQRYSRNDMERLISVILGEEA